MTLKYKQDGSVDYYATYTHTHEQHESYKKNNWGLIYHAYWAGRILGYDDKILEIGCGNGRLCQRLYTDQYDITGLDIIDKPADILYPYVQHDLTKCPWPFEYQQFDLGLAFDVLEHISYYDIDNVIKELLRVSKNQVLSIPHLKSVGKLHLIVEPADWWISKLNSISGDEWEIVQTIIKESGAGAGKPTSIIIRKG